MNVTIIYQIRIFIHLTFTVPSDLDTKHDLDIVKMYMSYFAYACKTERQNGISRLISELLRTLDSSLRDHLFHVTWKFLNSLIMQTC